ncbi:MAG: hypothetical protein K9W43_08975 [Candidatus Thorarchaeota archaeon]|nr:hypothetical protein [Candidatus Thorarchaeota archaeon]
MKTPVRTLVLGFIIVILIIITPARALTTDDPNEATWFKVAATHAEYCDADNDGFADDIITVFDITITNTDISFMITYMYCYLYLPSGDGYMVVIRGIGQYTYLSITMAWYNTVTESGWYTFIVYVEIPVNGFTYYSLDGITFDPPAGGEPGPPLVEIVSTNVTGTG